MVSRGIKLARKRDTDAIDKNSMALPANMLGLVDIVTQQTARQWKQPVNIQLGWSNIGHGLNYSVVWLYRLNAKQKSIILHAKNFLSKLQIVQIHYRP